ncbi:MAG: AraC family transcriptional regulator [Magnetospirillum gryphiswaldense]|nr:AraC family transcriptional regulator [Magnetospirillum gryphiswaldense]
MRQQRSRLWASADLGGMEMLDAHFIRQECPRHYHDTYAVGIVLQGVNRFAYRGMVHEAGPGSLCTVTVDEIHGGDVPTQDGLSYRCLYPQVEQVQAVQEDLHGHSIGELPLLPGTIHDQDAFALVARLFAAEQARASQLARQSLLTALLARVVACHGGGNPRPQRGARPGRNVQLARDILLDHLEQPPGLQNLAHQVGMTPLALLRGFRAAFGLPPHAWLIQARVRRAKDRILAGEGLADVAAQCGFADQSHMNRHFRRLLGVTPGALLSGG